MFCYWLLLIPSYFCALEKPCFIILDFLQKLHWYFPKCLLWKEICCFHWFIFRAPLLRASAHLHFTFNTQYLEYQLDILDKANIRYHNDLAPVVQSDKVFCYILNFTIFNTSAKYLVRLHRCAGWPLRACLPNIVISVSSLSNSVYASERLVNAAAYQDLHFHIQQVLLIIS